jgi:glycosyltransferase involved in cell wall biosynthesis
MGHDGVMISVVIPTSNSERLLPRCFDSLIPAAVRGVVREVIVADAGSTDATLLIADAAGAHVIHGRGARAALLAEGAKSARSDWLLFLRPETALEPGWEVEAESFISQEVMERPRAATFRFALEEFGGEARRAEALANLRAALFALPYGDQGLLIPKRLYQKLGGYRVLAAMEDADLVRRIGRRRLVSMRARAVNVARPKSGVLRGFALTLLHTLRVPSRLLALL